MHTLNDIQYTMSNIAQTTTNLIQYTSNTHKTHSKQSDINFTRQTVLKKGLIERAIEIGGCCHARNYDIVYIANYKTIYYSVLLLLLLLLPPRGSALKH